MKTLLLLSLILFTLQFSAIGQTITVNRDKICFDSIAATEAFNEIKLKDQIILAQDSVITNRDSLILVLSLQKDTLLNENKTIVKLYNDKNDQVNELAFKLVQSRKEAKIWFRAFKIGTAVLFGVLVLR